MPLRSPSSGGTRPITDRAKEALFSILHTRLRDAAFLDLFAGTGGVGIEALSRGTATATFIELDRAAYDDLQFNLQKTRLRDRAELVLGDAFDFIERDREQPFDIVFIAPPQWHELWDRALLALDLRPDLVANDGVVVVQCDPKEIRELPLQRFELYDTRRYGNVAFLFFRLGDAR